MQSCLDNLKRGDVVHYKTIYDADCPIVFDRHHHKLQNIMVQTSDPTQPEYWRLDLKHITKIVKAQCSTV